MSTSGRKRHRAFAAAAAVEERNSGFSTSTEIKCCPYPGCVKSQPDSMPERKFCGRWHRDLYMSNLANSRSASRTPSPGQELLAISSVAADVRQAEGNNLKCMLPECTRGASRDPNTGQHFDFCRKKHMLEMVERLTKVWSLQGRLCRLENCFNHVHVEDDGQCHEYCGVTHAKLAAARRGALVRPEEASAAASASNLGTIENRSLADHPVDGNVHDESDERRSKNLGQQVFIRNREARSSTIRFGSKESSWSALHVSVDMIDTHTPVGINFEVCPLQLYLPVNGES